jgi:hypothetical protein
VVVVVGSGGCGVVVMDLGSGSRMFNGFKVGFG